MDFADAGMIIGQFEFDFGVWKKPQANANLLRNRDLSFARNLHGITPTSKCNAHLDDEQQNSRAAIWSIAVNRTIVSGSLSNDLWLADTACAPDVERHTFANQRMKRFVQPGWFHGLSLLIWAGLFGERIYSGRDR
jgi:hypothetical protein